MSGLAELVALVKERQAKKAEKPAQPEKRTNPNAERFGFLHKEPEFIEGTSREIEKPREYRSDRTGRLAGRVVRSIAYARRFMRDVDPNVAAARVCRDVYKDTETSAWLDQAVERDLSASVPGEGGYLIPTQVQDDLIELLYPMVPVMELGATEVPLNSGSTSMPYVKSGSSAEYFGENEDMDVTDVEFGESFWTTKKLGALVAISNDLLSVASARADLVVSRDLTKQVAVRMNKGIFQDDGSSNRPRGIAYETGLTTLDLSAADFDPDDVPAIFAELADANVDLETMARPGWCMSHRFWEYLQKLKNLDGSYYYRSTGNGYAVSDGVATTGRVLRNWEGFTARCTQLITSSGSGPYTTKLYYGDWSEYWIVRKGLMRIDSSDVAAYKVGATMRSAFQRDQTLIRVLDNHGFGARQKKALARIDVRYTR